MKESRRPLAQRERERERRPEAESAGHLSAVLKHVLGFGLSSGWSWGNEGRVYSFKANVTNEVDGGSGRLSERAREREESLSPGSGAIGLESPPWMR